MDLQVTFFFQERVPLWLLEKVINIQPQAVSYHTALHKPLSATIHPSVKDAWAVFNPPEHKVVTQHHGHPDNQLKQEMLCHLPTQSESRTSHGTQIYSGPYGACNLLTWAVESTTTLVPFSPTSCWLVNWQAVDKRMSRWSRTWVRI